MNNFSLLLQTAVAVPLVAAVLMAFSRCLPCALKKALALCGFVVPAVIAVVLFVAFPCAEKEGGYAFVSGWEAFGVPGRGVWLQFGLNGISLPLFLMAALVGLAAGLRAIWTKDVRFPGLYFAVILVMFGGVLGVFSAIDIFSFYIFHEFALIPTFIAILIWGGHARKTTAITMAVYLTLGAMISLAGLFALYFATKDVCSAFSFLELRNAVVADGGFALENAGTIFAILLLGFGILVSLFPFHSWAPDTYSSAPTPISMLHAGVLKKFGLYGLIQLGALALSAGLVEWQNWIVWLALGNILLIGLITMTQKDLKQMISYSSVMHMGPLFLGIAAFAISGGNAAGIGGAVVLMFAHGLSVALLFHLGQAVYDRTGTFEMQKMGGLATKAPVLAAFFVAATMASIGLPGFANFWGELTIFTSLAQIQPAWLLGAIVLSIVISAIYGLRAVAKIFYGKNTGLALSEEKFEAVRDISLRERVPALVLFAALVAVGFVPSLITKSIDSTLAEDFKAGLIVPVAEEEIVPADVPAPAAPAEAEEPVPAEEEPAPVAPVPAEGEEMQLRLQYVAGVVVAASAEEEEITVNVVGAVAEPGEISLPEKDATLTRAIEAAGGALPEASLVDVIVLRIDARIVADVEKIRAGEEPDVPLKDGDKITVLEI